jgi:hypothetical protein
MMAKNFLKLAITIALLLCITKAQPITEQSIQTITQNQNKPHNSLFITIAAFLANFAVKFVKLTFKENKELSFTTSQ